MSGSIPFGRAKGKRCHGSNLAGKEESEGDAPPPGSGERLLVNTEPFTGMEEGGRSGQDPDLFG